MTSRHSLRTKIRQNRDRLDPRERDHLSRLVCGQLAASRLVTRAQRIACYFPAGNEVDLLPFIEFAWSAGKEVYLPVLGLRFTGQLWFVPFRPDDDLYLNRFGIPEPVHDKRHRRTKLRKLDIILLPLVGFDLQGNRIGMGGGFYDRTLANLQQTDGWPRPKRIGIAYQLQQTRSIPHEHWDIPLHAVATEQGITWF